MERGGPSAEEMGLTEEEQRPANDTTQNPDTAAVQANPETRRRPGFFQRMRESWQNRGQSRENYERITQTHNTCRELIDHSQNLTARDFREKKLHERYGGGLRGAIVKWLAGERDFRLDEDGETRRGFLNYANEFGRKAVISIFNRKTAAMAIPAALVGFLTGGVGLPALGAIYGAIGGRAVAEIWHSASSSERDLMQEIARAEFRQYKSLMETGSACQREGIDSQECNNRIEAFITKCHQINQEVAVRRMEIANDQAKWNKIRSNFTKWGALLGTAAGFWANWDKIMTMDLDGEKGAKYLDQAHRVEHMHGEWQYHYNSYDEAQRAAQALGLDPSNPPAYHQLGESTSTWQVIGGAARNLVPHILQVGAAFGGLKLANKYGESNPVEETNFKLAREERNRSEEGAFLAGQERPITERQIEPINWQERLGERMPQRNQIWTLVYPNGTRDLIRIENINQNELTVSPIDPYGGSRGENRTIDMTEIEQYGRTPREFIENWQRQFQNGDVVNLGEGYRTESDQAIPEGQYHIVVNREHPETVTLRQAGQSEFHLSALPLALVGVNRIVPEREIDQPEEPERRQEGPILPAQREIWHREEDPVGLPENLRNLPERFSIDSVNVDRGLIYIHDTANRDTRDTIRITDWPRIARIYVSRGIEGGGGQPNRRR